MSIPAGGDLAYISAVDALELFAKRELSPVELMRAVVDRAEATEPLVNALVDRRYDEALERAKSAERVYADSKADPRPLEGIPFAMKEEFPMAGHPLTSGSLTSADAVAETTSIFAQRLLDSGVIVHARSTTPEFSVGPYTHSRLWGVTRNPWNTDFSPGGSSGGSAASLAAGSTTLASGSDIAGSIRIPASFTGTVGFKPPYGRVPVDPPHNMNTFMHNGPMARTVGDVALLQNVIAGAHPDDPASLSPKVTVNLGSSDLRGMRIAVSVDLGGWPVDPEIRRNTNDAADDLRSLGAVVEEVDVHVPRDLLLRVYGLHVYPDVVEMDEFLAENARHLSPYIAGALSAWRTRGAAGSAGEYTRLATKLDRSFATIFGDFDAFVCPTVNTRGFRAGDTYPHGIDIDGTNVEIDEALMTMPFNILSQHPVLSIPSGLAENGVPTGLQVVGPKFDDSVVFRVAAALEGVRPLWGASRRALPMSTRD